MRAGLSLALLIILAPSRAAAQGTTADGIQALIRGEYDTAVRVLRPLAEGTAPADPLAQFFLASLYQSGRGVGPDPIHACVLYRNAANAAHPFAHQSLVLADLLAEPLSHLPRPWNEACDANADVWREPSPASFTLGPDHRVTIDQAGVTVSYRGAEKRANGSFGGPGFVFLPVRYTPVDVSRPLNMRRHFLQYLFWTPYQLADQRAWLLGWTVSEIVGLDIVPVTGDANLTTAAGAQPPAAFDADGLVSVHTNGDGDAEWIVMARPNPRRAVIPYGGPR